MIEIDNIDHIGIRVSDRDRAIKFYNLFGFKSVRAADNDDVIVMKNDKNVEINIIFNANNNNNNNNILMDEVEKFPGYTHVAFRVDSIKSTIEKLNKNNIKITQGPVAFGQDGHVSVFLRDPDRNTLELRGRAEDLSALGGVEIYEPLN
jgi:catechol 2,3-dioxygenase-like lactoylglutathione lyase family enzyme|tara:strand:- start:631 stop:1077 length:447 start_codon:yes stop_codon:yes gene_type:complete